MATLQKRERAKAPTVHKGDAQVEVAHAAAQLLAMWAAPFDSDNLAEGGCPAVHA